MNRIVACAFSLKDVKNRGIQDILILCSDGLTGLKEAVQAAYHSTERQRCIVHMVRNTLKYVSHKLICCYLCN